MSHYVMKDEVLDQIYKEREELITKLNSKDNLAWNEYVLSGEIEAFNNVLSNHYFKRNPLEKNGWHWVDTDYLDGLIKEYKTDEVGVDSIEDVPNRGITTGNIIGLKRIIEILNYHKV